MGKKPAHSWLVIHIASHFKLRSGDNSRSFLLLGQDITLTMADQTSQANGAEIESFGVLVQELGAKAVLATLWPVSDQSTGLFMQNFYKLREQDKLTKAEALRQAQLIMIQGQGTNNYSSPYFWAPFVLMGNWL